eukprot:4544818-Amphidinium_carterae.4
MYRLWAGARYRMLSEWATRVFDKQFHTYLPHRDARTAAAAISCSVDEILLDRRAGGTRQLHMVALDCIQAFPSVSRAQVAQILLRVGMCPVVVNAWLRHYDACHFRWRCRGKIVHDTTFQLRTGIAQGRSLSVLAFQAMQLPLVLRLNAMFPSVHICVYVDDVTLWCRALSLL